MLGVQVDLILGTVQPEPDRVLGGAAVDVIDEQGLHFLGNGCSVPPADRRTILHCGGRVDVAGVLRRSFARFQ
jgi:hypothetical protein